jgi:hypothetical protein
MITAKEKINRMKRLLTAQTNRKDQTEAKQIVQTKLKTMLQSTLKELESKVITPTKKGLVAGKIYRKPLKLRDRNRPSSSDKKSSSLESSDSIENIITNKALRRAYGIKKKVRFSKKNITHMYFKKNNKHRDELFTKAVERLRVELSKNTSLHKKDILIEQEIKLIMIKDQKFNEETGVIDIEGEIENLQTNREYLNKELNTIIEKEKKFKTAKSNGPILKKPPMAPEPAMLTEDDIRKFDEQWETLDTQRLKMANIPKQETLPSKNIEVEVENNKENYSVAANTHRSEFESTWKELENTQKMILFSSLPYNLENKMEQKQIHQYNKSNTLLPPIQEIAAPVLQTMVTPRSLSLKSALKKEKTPQSSHHRVKFDNEVIKSEFTNKLSKYYRYAKEDGIEETAINIESDAPTPKFK